MSRYLLFLLLTTCLALADERPKAQHAAGIAEAQTKTEAAQAQTEQVRAQKEKAHGQAQGAPGQSVAAEAKPEAAQAQTEHVQAQTGEAQSQTQRAQGQTQEAEEKPEEVQTDESGKLKSVPGAKALGMSILGNQEAPKSLVIVPWKTSELGRSPGISPMLDDSRQPVDKEVFMRALRYYEIRSETKQ